MGREVVEKSQATSPSASRPYGLKRVCEAWEIPRSSFYREKPREQVEKRGPKPLVGDDILLEKIQEDLQTTPFKGEGHRKVHVRLKRQGVKVGRNRVLKIMKDNQLLSPHRSPYQPPNPHDGRISTDAPNVMWGSDGTKVKTVDNGWVWIFSVAEHWNTECLGWHVCKKGDRFAALEPVAQAVKRVYGALSRGIASGMQLRIDNGSQYTSDYFLGQLKYWGMESSFGIVRQPETNGVSERFHRTLKEQVINGRVFKNADEVREAVRAFVEVYNSQWLVAKRGYQSPVEARRNYEKLQRVA